ncbi:MAG: sulfite exporter TauE/SafE family protein [Chloroflexi bacterium]|nr:sulfite exporter TauE/SafE family protein [Chloroflexota bacterium]MBU1750448.1 sulfite exporter TauE/SafE family protein [Chloroflexota bacterium]
MDPDIGMYGVLLLSGLLGSLGHCLGMCGPLVMMVGLQLPARGLAAWPYHLLYHGARIAVYALLGAVVGAIGSLLGLGGQLSGLGSVVSLLLGLGVVLLGLGYLGWLPVGRLEGGGDWVSRGMSRALQQGGLLGVVLLGALNGLLPCGLVYSALLVTASTGGPLPAALGMLLFGAGTIPALLVVGLGAGALSAAARQRLSRLAGVLIVLVGGQLLLRGLAGLGVVSHLRLGDVVLW